MFFPPSRRLGGEKKNERSWIHLRFADDPKEEKEATEVNEREKPFGAHVFHERNPIARAVSRIGIARDTTTTTTPLDSARFRSSPPRRIGSARRIDRDARV